MIPPPGWHLQFDALDHDWVRRLRGCPQDPDYHAEGDVYVHTRMVVEQMTALTSPLEERLQTRLLTAALLHDVAKPACTRLDEGRWTSRGHSRRGEIMARRILWELDAPFDEREAVAALISAHQIPFWLLDREAPARLVHAFSQRGNCAHLALLAEADARGRIAVDQQKLLDNVQLFVEYCREAGCLDGPRQFSSDHSRFMYFRRDDRDVEYSAYDDTRTEVVLMSGLPGAGKDTWIGQHLADWPVVSLDRLRAEMRVAPTEPQGPVVAAAREQARVHLRAGQRFVWNATNLSRDVRKRCIDLFADYGARVRIVYVEASRERLERQIDERARSVPWDAVEAMLERWEVPDRTEAHQLDIQLWT